MSLEPDPEYPAYKIRAQKAYEVLSEWESLITAKLALLTSQTRQEQLNLLIGDPLLFELLYFYDLAGLLNIKKQLRLSGGMPDACQPGVLLEKALSFIRELNKKATSHG